jgi:phospholipase/carboxylesterase
VSALTFAERPPAGPDGSGLLVLHHGRGTDERDLLGLGEELDPQRRLHVISPRAPLRLPGLPGYHWYAVPRVGYPDPATFYTSYTSLGELHDELWQRTGLGPERTVLGGFSMGAVMSYALALGADRPPPSGVMAFSGFIPVVEGWRAHPGDRTTLRVFTAHGLDDPVIAVDFARRARAQLTAASLRIDYHESPGGHEIIPAHIPPARAWLAELIGAQHLPSRQR